MIEYKTDSSKGNHNIHVETDNYKYYRIIEELVRLFIDHKLDFINIDGGAEDECKKCDRCGKLYEENEVDIRNPFHYKITKDCHPYPDEIEIDLCDKCRENFKEWLKGR